jgi:polar amino acid transport system permease protein
MIRELGLIDLVYLLGAARWTLALAVVAFIGGGLVGLLVAVLRILPFRPARWLAAA